jgi:hypothetical protein
MLLSSTEGMMYQLPQKFKAELYKEFDFTREFTNESALLHNWGEGRILCSPLPPFRNGVVELYVNKALGNKAELIVLVLPCDVSTDWFHKLWAEYKASELRQVLLGETTVSIRFIKGRLKYDGGEGEESRFKHRVPACVVVIRNSS